MTGYGQKILDVMIMQFLCEFGFKKMLNECDYHLKANMRTFQCESSVGN